MKNWECLKALSKDGIRNILSLGNGTVFCQAAPRVVQKSYINLDNIETGVRIVVPVAGLILTGYLTMKLLNNLNPTSKDKQSARRDTMKILKKFNIPNPDSLTDYEVSIATMLMDPETIQMNWNSIGGHDDIIQDLREYVMTPFTNVVYDAKGCPSKLFVPPKGVLLHGPPGCGKTLIAKALAKTVSARFINLEIKSLVNMWYGESQKLTEAVFSLARKIQPTVIFIDEIDSFLNARSAMDNEATRMMKTQFMAMWDGILNQSDKIMVIGTTNRPSDLDVAILRRLPYRVHVPMPIQEMREEIFRIILKEELVNFDDPDKDFLELSKLTSGCSGADIQEVCRIAALRRFNEARSNVKDLTEQPDYAITKTDISYAIDMFRRGQNKIIGCEKKSFEDIPFD